jgi:hypothetical protein
LAARRALQISNSGISSISSLGKLTSLVAVDNFMISEEGLQHITHLTALEVSGWRPQPARGAPAAGSGGCDWWW